jgi:septal ring factor EnvC (AmiA/AmiB activator)
MGGKLCKESRPKCKGLSPIVPQFCAVTIPLQISIKIMKTNFSKLSLMAGVLTMGLMACSDTPKDKEIKVMEAENKLDDARDDYQTSMTDSINEYRQFKAETDQKLAENETKIADLKARMKADKKEINENYEKDLAKMEKSNEKLKTKLNEFKEDGAEDWESFKSNVNREMDELGKSISEMAQRN